MQKEKLLIVIFMWVFLIVLPPQVLAQTGSSGSITTYSDSSLIHFDKKIFSWTDRVYITVYAPDFDFDPNAIDTIGQTQDDKLSVCTTGNCIPYKLTETGTNTGIFSGYVTLTGSPTVKGATGIDGQGENPSGMMSRCNPICGPTDGLLPSTGNDGVSVSFEYTRDKTVTGSALVRWHSGTIKWLQPSYVADGQGVLEIDDPDMSLNPDAINKFDTNVWSDSDSGGTKINMVETSKGSGIFQGVVYFSSQFPSSGNRLHASNGDTVTAEYRDRTLPPPHSTSDEIRILATTAVGTSVPPLERVSMTNPRIIDSLGNPVDKIAVNQQIQIASDVLSNLNYEQSFAYLVQIQDSNGIAVSVSWITGSLSPHQSMTLSQSWAPKVPGVYTAQILTWQSIANPDALSSPLTLQIKAS